MTHASSIAQLQSDWFEFSDLDRASAVLAIKMTGISTRSIAAQLQLRESLLRHLLWALLAPACDQDLARQGRISSNELVRRAKACMHPAKHHETLAIDRDREIRIAADLIYNWLPHAQLFGPALEMIVKGVQYQFLRMKDPGHPPAVAHPGTSVSQIILRTKPPADDRIDIVAQFARWLCRWSFYAFPNKMSGITHLGLALQKQRAS